MLEKTWTRRRHHVFLLIERTKNCKIKTALTEQARGAKHISRFLFLQFLKFLVRQMCKKTRCLLLVRVLKDSKTYKFKFISSERKLKKKTLKAPTSLLFITWLSCFSFKTARMLKFGQRDLGSRRKSDSPLGSVRS